MHLELNLVIKEYWSPVSGDLVSHFLESGELYIVLVNGSKIPMQKTITYNVGVNRGEYIIMRYNGVL